MLDKLHGLIKIEFPEDVEHGLRPLLFDARPLILDKRVEPHVVILRILAGYLAQGDFDGNKSTLLVVFDCVLDKVKDDELINPPVRANGFALSVLASELHVLGPGDDLGLEGLQNFFYLYLGRVFKLLQDAVLFLLYFHFLDLVRVVEVEQFCRVKDLLSQLIVLLIEPEQVDVVLLPVLLPVLWLSALLDLGQNHFGVVQDAVQGGHLLVGVIGLDGILVQMVRKVLLQLDHLAHISQEEVKFHLVMLEPDLKYFFVIWFLIAVCLVGSIYLRKFEVRRFYV